MTFIPTPHTARVVVRFTKGSEGYSNVFHFEKPSFTLTDMENLAAAVDAIVGGSYMSIWNNHISYVATDVYDIRTSTGQIVTESTTGAPGTVAGEGLPTNLAVVVTLRTATRGRTGRGRVYVAGFSESNLDEGVFNSGTLPQAKSYVDNVIAEGLAVGWVCGVRSIQTDGVINNPALMRPVTDTEVRSGIPGTQRRRLDRP